MTDRVHELTVYGERAGEDKPCPYCGASMTFLLAPLVWWCDCRCVIDALTGEFLRRGDGGE